MRAEPPTKAHRGIRGTAHPGRWLAPRLLGLDRYLGTLARVVSQEGQGRQGYAFGRFSAHVALPSEEVPSTSDGVDAETSAAQDDGERDVGHYVRGPFQHLLPRRAAVSSLYTVRDQWVDLERISQRPRKVFNWRHVVALVKRTTDFFGHRQGWFGSFLTRINPYPAPFRRVHIRSFDGTLISGWLGLQSVARPAVLMVPGMFSSKDDTVHKSKAIAMWRRWNYNVLIIDLRGFGQSGEAPNTAGWKEAEDVLAAARFLSSFNTVTKVGVMAESLGATATLLAAAQEGAWERDALARIIADAEAEAGDESDLDLADGVARTAAVQEAAAPSTGVPMAYAGGVGAVRGEDPDWHLPGARPLLAAEEGRPEETALGPELPPGRLPKRVIDAVMAVSPFADPRLAITHINTMPHRRDPFYQVQRLFVRLLRMRTRGSHADFMDYMRHSAGQYGVTLEELFERSDLRRVVHQIRCPTLVLHAEDDQTVSVRHAQVLKELVEDREDLMVWVIPWGRHAEFDLLDHRWFWRVLSRFMGQWVGR